MKYLALLFISSYCISMSAQTGLGINTSAPDRVLEVRGFNEQYIRMQSTPVFGNETGLELMSPTLDWRISDDIGLLKFIVSDNNFLSGNNEIMRFSTSGRLGIGTTLPQSRLHVDGGTLLSLVDHGFMMLGNKFSTNLVFDHSRIQARTGAATANLFIQPDGGKTNFGPSSVRVGIGGGKFALGGGTTQARMSIYDDEYQIYLSNDEAHVNDWYIGASDASWLVGDDQLIFSPTSSSGDAILRLMDVTDNDGEVAPVVISSSSGQTLLLDGTEIDCKTGPLYFNYNSEENTYINPSGGKVGIGTTSPVAPLHVKGSDLGIGLRNDNVTWYIYPSVTEDLFFRKGNAILAYVSIADGGEWISLSDMRFKEEIKPLGSVMDKLMRIGLYKYSYKHDEHNKSSIGVMAQELEELFPEAVSEDNGQYGVMYGQLAALALQGTKEQQNELNRLSALLDSVTPNSGVKSSKDLGKPESN